MKGIFIFVLDRGFVIAAEAEVSKELAFHWHFKRSKTIRRWGTSKGIAELKDGPTKDTILDATAERFVSFRAVIDIIKVTEKGATAWTKVLSD